ncbi:MAG: hypothetical protein DRI57_03515, partial [Deltaproteobacteria bacterium]
MLPECAVLPFLILFPCSCRARTTGKADKKRKKTKKTVHASGMRCSSLLILFPCSCRELQGKRIRKGKKRKRQFMLPECAVLPFLILFPCSCRARTTGKADKKRKKTKKTVHASGMRCSSLSYPFSL